MQQGGEIYRGRVCMGRGGGLRLLSPNLLPTAASYAHNSPCIHQIISSYQSYDLCYRCCHYFCCCLCCCWWCRCCSCPTLNFSSSTCFRAFPCALSLPKNSSSATCVPMQQQAPG